jgi:hypothetical protein
VFEAALGTPFTQLTNPNARELIARHRSHILVNVHHGPMSPTSEIAALLARMDMSRILQAGQSLDHFRERLSLCGVLSALAHSMGKASLVHWTSSDHLLTGDVFVEVAPRGVPSLLHIHPFLFNGGKSADGRNQITITTFGAKYFVGREVHLAANPIPWQESLGVILTFLNLATMQNGYIIPDDDTFGDEDDSLRCRVRHIPEGAKSVDFDGPLYRLELVYSRKHGFTSPDYHEPVRTFDDRTVPADILSDLGRERAPIVEDWHTKRQMVESVGGRLVVGETARPREGWDFRRVFGRKKPQGDA